VAVTRRGRRKYSRRSRRKEEERERREGGEGEGELAVRYRQ